MEIAIIGGGITGLTTSIALSQQGIAATVFERSPEIQTVGAGIWLQPNAMRVLGELGLKEDLLTQGAVLQRADITNSQLKPFKETGQMVMSDSHGNRTLAIHRGRLQAVLMDHARKNQKVLLGKEFVGYEQGQKIRVMFQDGDTEADVLLGCDGIRSEVRNQVFPEARLRASGQICWRGIASLNLDAPYRNRGFEAWGSGLRFGLSNISDSEVYWFAVAKLPVGDGVKTTDDLAELFKGFHPQILSIISNTSSFHTDVLSDLQRLPNWHKGDCGLLGDAAHATTPNMGQGACQGIEDAYFISQLFQKKDNPEAAFTALERLRRKKVDYIVNTSWRFGKAAHSALGRKVLPWIIRMTPEKVVSQQLQQLYQLSEV